MLAIIAMEILMHNSVFMWFLMLEITSLSDPLILAGILCSQPLSQHCLLVGCNLQGFLKHFIKFSAVGHKFIPLLLTSDMAITGQQGIVQY